MKTLPFAIFDMDGTLVDSMPCWYSLHGDYVRARYPDTPPHVLKDIEAAWGFENIFAAFLRHGIAFTREDYFSFLEERMGYYYSQVVEPKPKTKALLEGLKKAGCKMGVITMTPHRGADFCLAKTGLAPYFSFVLTREDTPDGSGKEKELIFRMAMEKLGCEKAEDCAFYEDSLYAIKTAHKMGFYVRAVEDRWGEETHREISALADEVVSLGYHLPHKA